MYLKKEKTFLAPDQKPRGIEPSLLLSIIQKSLTRPKTCVKNPCGSRGFLPASIARGRGGGIKTISFTRRYREKFRRGKRRINAVEFGHRLYSIVFVAYGQKLTRARLSDTVPTRVVRKRFENLNQHALSGETRIHFRINNYCGAKNDRTVLLRSKRTKRKIHTDLHTPSPLPPDRRRMRIDHVWCS